jgi:hypothetical protein
MGGVGSGRPPGIAGLIKNQQPKPYESDPENFIIPNYSGVKKTALKGNPDPTAPNPFTSGMIIMWSGDYNSPPTGWVICDGNNGTPDLTQKFILAADNSNYYINDSGGRTDGSLTGSVYGNIIGDLVAGTQILAVGGTLANSLEGGVINGSYDFHFPSYYVLAFIMKT